MGCPDCLPYGERCRGPRSRRMPYPEDEEIECECACHRCADCGSPFCDQVGGHEACRP